MTAYVHLRDDAMEPDRRPAIEYLQSDRIDQAIQGTPL
jgi:hypothetical protein